MTDASAIQEAYRRGFPCFYQHDKCWFSMPGVVEPQGPYANIDDAARAACAAADIADVLTKELKERHNETT